jgi:hypothetical protein
MLISGSTGFNRLFASALSAAKRHFWRDKDSALTAGDNTGEKRTKNITHAVPEEPSLLNTTVKQFFA